jgi:hypothetical protein
MGLGVAFGSCSRFNFFLYLSSIYDEWSLDKLTDNMTIV